MNTEISRTESFSKINRPLPLHIVTDGTSTTAELEVADERQDEELRIQLLGEFRLSVGKKAIHESEWYLRKAKNLVKLLALASNHRLHRGQLVDLLWPELDPEAATNNLHKVLHIGRRVLEPDLPPKTPSRYLHMSGEFVYLDPPGRLWIDVEAFRAAAEKAQRSQDLTAYEEALRLYGGDLSPEDRYDDWAIHQRDELKSMHVALLLGLAELHERRGEFDMAIEVLRQAVAADPANEQAQAALMRLLACSGHRQLALRQYQQLRDALRQELDVEPDSSIQSLYHQILSGELPSVPQPTPPTSSSAGEALARSSVSQPLLGRDLELGISMELLDRLFEGSGGIIFLTGPAGIGKSRLAAAIEEEASLRGAITLWGAAYRRKNQVTYGPFVAALEGFTIRVAPDILQDLLGNSASDLAALAPGIKLALDLDGDSTPSPTVSDASKIATALSTFFARLCEHAPSLIVLEDLQVADEGSLLLLRHLAAVAESLPLLFVCNFRSDEVASGSQLDGLRRELESEEFTECLALRSLGHRDTELLVTKLLGGPVDQAVLEIVHSVASGNPYYVEETVRALRGRSRIRQVVGVWQIRKGVTIAWDRNHLRQRPNASGHYRLAACLRPS